MNALLYFEKMQDRDFERYRTRLAAKQRALEEGVGGGGGATSSGAPGAGAAAPAGSGKVQLENWKRSNQPTGLLLRAYPFLIPKIYEKKTHAKFWAKISAESKKILCMREIPCVPTSCPTSAENELEGRSFLNMSKNLEQLDDILECPIVMGKSAEMAFPIVVDKPEGDMYNIFTKEALEEVRRTTNRHPVTREPLAGTVIHKKLSKTAQLLLDFEQAASTSMQRKKLWRGIAELVFEEQEGADKTQKRHRRWQEVCALFKEFERWGGVGGMGGGGGRAARAAKSVEQRLDELLAESATNELVSESRIQWATIKDAAFDHRLARKFIQGYGGSSFVVEYFGDYRPLLRKMAPLCLLSREEQENLYRIGGSELDIELVIQRVRDSFSTADVKTLFDVEGRGVLALTAMPESLHWLRSAETCVNLVEFLMHARTIALEQRTVSTAGNRGSSAAQNQKRPPAGPGSGGAAASSSGPAPRGPPPGTGPDIDEDPLSLHGVPLLLFDDKHIALAARRPEVRGRGVARFPPSNIGVIPRRPDLFLSARFGQAAENVGPGPGAFPGVRKVKPSDVSMEDVLDEATLRMFRDNDGFEEGGSGLITLKDLANAEKAETFKKWAINASRAFREVGASVGNTAHLPLVPVEPAADGAYVRVSTLSAKLVVRCENGPPTFPATDAEMYTDNGPHPRDILAKVLRGSKFFLAKASAPAGDGQGGPPQWSRAVICDVLLRDDVLPNVRTLDGRDKTVLQWLVLGPDPAAVPSAALRLPIFEHISGEFRSVSSPPDGDHPNDVDARPVPVRLDSVDWVHVDEEERNLFHTTGIFGTVQGRALPVFKISRARAALFPRAPPDNPQVIKRHYIPFCPCISDFLTSTNHGLPTLTLPQRRLWVEYIRKKFDQYFAAFRNSPNSQNLLQNIRPFLHQLASRVFFVAENTPAGAYFDPHNRTCSEFLDDSKFPPPPYRTDAWLGFLRALGLQKDLSGDVLLEEARRIQDRYRQLVAADGADHRTTQDFIEQTARKKAELLVEMIARHLAPSDAAQAFIYQLLNPAANRPDYSNQQFLTALKAIEFVPVLEKTWSNFGDAPPPLRLRALQNLVFDKTPWEAVFSQYSCMAIPFPDDIRDRDVVAAKLGLRKVDVETSALPHLQALVQTLQGSALNVTHVCGALSKTSAVLVNTVEESNWPDLGSLKNEKWFPSRRLDEAADAGGFEKPTLCFSDVASVLGARIPNDAASLLNRKLALLHSDMVRGATLPRMLGVVGNGIEIVSHALVTGVV